MRMVRNLMVALAVLASATVANADSFVWFTTPNVNGNGAGLAGGAQGSALNLTCDTSGPNGSCSWAITMMLNTGTGGIVEHNTNLATGPGVAGNIVSASAAALAPGQPFTTNGSAGAAGAGPALLVGAHGSAVVAGGLAANTSHQMLTFTLTRSFTTGNLASFGVLAGASSDQTFVWANNNGDYETVVFGGNAGLYSEPGATAANPVINITAVPEPTSLGLLALGALAVIRRRVAR